MVHVLGVCELWVRHREDYLVLLGTRHTAQPLTKSLLSCSPSAPAFGAAVAFAEAVDCAEFAFWSHAAINQGELPILP